MARTKRTPENRKRILDMLRAATTTRKAAYSAVGMSGQAFANWINGDKKFAQEVEEAEQEAITRNVLLVQKAAQPRQVRKTTTKRENGNVVVTTVEEYTEPGDWRAAMTLLERRDPEHYGRRDRLDLSIEKMNDDQLRSEVEALLQRLAATGRSEEEGLDTPGRE